MTIFDQNNCFSDNPLPTNTLPKICDFTLFAYRIISYFRKVNISKSIRIVLLAIVSMSIGWPVVAQVTRIDTVEYNETLPQKRKVQTFNTDYLYTIGVKLYGHEQFPAILNQSNNDSYFSTYFNGLFLGYTNNQITYRLHLSHFRNDSFGNNSCVGCEEAFGKLQNTTLKLGFQYNTTYLRVQPYLGADLGVMLQRYESGYVPAGDLATIHDRKVAALVSPFVGVRAFIIPRLSVAAEANFNVAHSSQKTSGGIDGRKTKHSWETFFSPVAGITLQYHFGSLTY